jgi:hypothetical protein
LKLFGVSEKVAGRGQRDKHGAMPYAELAEWRFRRDVRRPSFPLLALVVQCRPGHLASLLTSI